jgi:hypothetical protein
MHIERVSVYHACIQCVAIELHAVVARWIIPGEMHHSKICHRYIVNIHRTSKACRSIGFTGTKSIASIIDPVLNLLWIVSTLVDHNQHNAINPAIKCAIDF